VLDQQLADNQFIAGSEYTIADMGMWPKYGNGMLNGTSYNDLRKFLQTHKYKNVDESNTPGRQAGANGQRHQRAS
jgi:GSH-dependent disulfide-bond oxidoreductase